MLNFTHNDSANADGTSLARYVSARYTDIAARFGDGRVGDGDGKVMYEWAFESGPYVVTLYDWKTGDAHVGTYNWHVGAKSGVVADLFVEWLMAQL